MSHTLKFELNRRWKLWITAGTDDEYQLIVDSDQELASQFTALRSDPAVSSIGWAPYSQDQPTLAGLR